jgi:hypothetical protein
MSNVSPQRPSALGVDLTPLAPRPRLARLDGDESSPTLDALGHLHAFIEDNWDALYAACRTDADRTRLAALQGWARDAYLTAIDQGFQADASTVAQLSRDIAAATRAIGGQLVALKDITAGLALLATAVKLAAGVAGVVTTL